MEQIEFDEALREAVAWTMGRDDTLLIVTTDHANANPGLTLYDRRNSGLLDRLMQLLEVPSDPASGYCLRPADGTCLTSSSLSRSYTDV